MEPVCGFSRYFNNKRLNLSNSWLNHHRKRNGLKEMKRHREAASENTDTEEGERRIQVFIKTYGCEPRDIFVMDETSFFSAYVPIFIFSSSMPST